MTTIAVAKNDAGQLQGLTDNDQRAWLRFWNQIEELDQGEFFTIDYWFPRNPKLHRLHFVIINAFFDAQERFSDAEALRGWLYVGAGHCDFHPGPDGQTVAIPRSIKWSKVDDVDFQRIHDAMIGFIRGEYARAHLWPHLSAETTYELVELLLSQFERQP